MMWDQGEMLETIFKFSNFEFPRRYIQYEYVPGTSIYTTTRADFDSSVRADYAINFQIWIASKD